MAYVDFVGPAVDYRGPHCDRWCGKAADADEKQDYKTAYQNYIKAVEFFQTAIKHEKQNKGKREMLTKKAEEILARAEKIKEHLDAGPTSPGE
eukprot:gene25738-6983_t